MNYIQKYPKEWITYTCSYLVNLMIQYSNQIWFIFAVNILMQTLGLIHHYIFCTKWFSA